VPPITLAATCALIGALTLRVLSFVLRSFGVTLRPAEGWRQWALFASIGIFEAIVPLLLLTWGQRRVTSSIAAILMATIPLFVLMLLPLFSRGSFHLMSLVSVVIGFVGVVVLFYPSIGGFDGSLIGNVAVLGAALSYAVSLILLSKLPDISPLVSMRSV
jgi:drug/metabolite transporter (DMT)-like permease